MSIYLHPLIMRAKASAEAGFTRVKDKSRVDNALALSICETYINDSMRAQYLAVVKTGKFDPDVRSDNTIFKMMRDKK
jgi:hypothetical protein